MPAFAGEPLLPTAVSGRYAPQGQDYGVHVIA